MSYSPPLPVYSTTAYLIDGTKDLLNEIHAAQTQAPVTTGIVKLRNLILVTFIANSKIKCMDRSQMWNQSTQSYWKEVALQTVASFLAQLERQLPNQNP